MLSLRRLVRANHSHTTKHKYDAPHARTHTGGRLRYRYMTPREGRLRSSDVPPSRTGRASSVLFLLVRVPPAINSVKQEMASITPYLASIGLLADDAPTLQTIPTTSVEYAPVEWPPSSLHTESTSLLDSLQKQYGRAVDVQHDIATRKLASYEQDRDNAQARAGAALAAGGEWRGSGRHAQDGDAPQGDGRGAAQLHAELESLRSLHTREVQEEEREADEEHGRLRTGVPAIGGGRGKHAR